MHNSGIIQGSISIIYSEPIAMLYSDSCRRIWFVEMDHVHEGVIASLTMVLGLDYVHINKQITGENCIWQWHLISLMLFITFRNITMHTISLKTTRSLYGYFKLAEYLSSCNSRLCYLHLGHYRQVQWLAHQLQDP